MSHTKKLISRPETVGVDHKTITFEGQCDCEVKLFDHIISKMQEGIFVQFSTNLFGLEIDLVKIWRSKVTATVHIIGSKLRLPKKHCITSWPTTELADACYCKVVILLFFLIIKEPLFAKVFSYQLRKMHKICILIPYTSPDPDISWYNIEQKCMSVFPSFLSFLLWPSPNDSITSFRMRYIISEWHVSNMVTHTV